MSYKRNDDIAHNVYVRMICSKSFENYLYGQYMMVDKRTEYSYHSWIIRTDHIRRLMYVRNIIFVSG